MGEQPVDLLINSAGMGGSGNGVSTLEFGELERYFSVNGLGPMRVTKALLGNLRQGQSRRVRVLSVLCFTLAG